MRLHRQQQPDRNQQKRDKDAEQADPADISADDGILSELFGMLEQVKDRDRGNHHRGRGIDDNDDMSLNQVRRGHIGALGITNYRKGVPERTGNKFFDRFLGHRQSIDIDLLNFRADIAYDLRIGDILDIHDCNIANRTAPDIDYLAPELGIADPPPDQGYIKNQRFNKAVPRSPRNFLNIGLVRITHRVFPGVDEQALRLSVDQEQHRTG